MTLVVTWGRGNRRPVSTEAELDAVLDEVVAPGAPCVVGIYTEEQVDPETSPWDGPQPAALQIGIGHPERAFIYWLGPEGGVGVDPAAEPWRAGEPDIPFDYAGDPVFAGAERARATPHAARVAAREFVRTGQRPASVGWSNESR